MFINGMIHLCKQGKNIIYKNENPGDPTRPEAQLLLEHSDVEVIKNEELDF